MASRPAIEEADQALVERSRRDLQLAWGRLRASLEERVLIIEACVVVVLTGASTEKLRKDVAGAANELATMFGRLRLWPHWFRRFVLLWLPGTAMTRSMLLWSCLPTAVSPTAARFCVPSRMSSAEHRWSWRRQTVA